MTENTNFQHKEILKANHRCEFELFDRDDLDYEGESKLVFGYCVIDTQNKKHHYAAIEQGSDYDDPLTVYPPCHIVGSTVLISWKNFLVECWSIEQYNLASSSLCATISPVKQFQSM